MTFTSLSHYHRTAIGTKQKPPFPFRSNSPMSQHPVAEEEATTANHGGEIGRSAIRHITVPL